MILMEQLRSIKRELGLEKDDKSSLIENFRKKWEPKQDAAPEEVRRSVGGGKRQPGRAVDRWASVLHLEWQQGQLLGGADSAALCCCHMCARLFRACKQGSSSTQCVCAQCLQAFRVAVFQ